MEMATRGRRSRLSSSDNREIASKVQTGTKIAPRGTDEKKIAPLRTDEFLRKPNDAKVWHRTPTYITV